MNTLHDTRLDRKVFLRRGTVRAYNPSRQLDTPNGVTPMATAIDTQQVDPQQIKSIGSVSGLVWCYLNDNGPVTLSKLAREIDVPRDLTMQGVGWRAKAKSPLKKARETNILS